MSSSRNHGPDHVDRVALYAIHALPPDEASLAKDAIAGCGECRRELDALRPVVESFVSWPIDVLRPAAPLWDRLARRIAGDAGEQPVRPSTPRPSEAEWSKVAPGIWVKLLATDAERHRVSMLVRLEPGTDYPAHTHAGTEELHLLDGELWIDDRKLFPGDYSHAEAGSTDRRVRSETGCTCLLVTSPDDVLR